MFILFDIGGTKTRITSAFSSDNFNDPIILDTPKTYEEGIELMKSTILDLTKGQTIQKIFGGIAGPVDQHTHSLIQSRNLPLWVGKPLTTDLEHYFHTSVFLDNDSAMVGLGEAVYGAGKDFSIVEYITVSTGVGGARIVNGAIDERSIGFEPGHQIVGENGESLEELISGRAIMEKMGKKAEEISDESFWKVQAEILARGLNNTIADWSPDVVVLGGSMMNKVGISVLYVEESLKRIFTAFPTLPPLKKAVLGDLGGLYGGLACIRKSA